MNITYESINNSTGINNSYARKVDGDCGWVKTPAISAGAPNKTNNTSSATYEFSTLNASQCNGTTGTISITVSAADVASLFPMNYTLAFDEDGNNIFNSNDQYFYGVDSSAPSIQISNLVYGRYRITVATSSSCNLKSYDFYIFNCYGVALPIGLLDFSYGGKEGRYNVFKCRIDDAKEFRSVVLENGDGTIFNEAGHLDAPLPNDFVIKAEESLNENYRLRFTDLSGKITYSQTIKVDATNQTAPTFWKDEVNDQLHVRFKREMTGKVDYYICTSTGSIVKKTSTRLPNGDRTLTVDLKDLRRGFYFIGIYNESMKEQLVWRFIK